MIKREHRGQRRKIKIMIVRELKSTVSTSEIDMEAVQL